jgi:hypothetical protein
MNEAKQSEMRDGDCFVFKTFSLLVYEVCNTYCGVRRRRRWGCQEGVVGCLLFVVADLLFAIHYLRSIFDPRS